MPSTRASPSLSRSLLASLRLSNVCLVYFLIPLASSLVLFDSMSPVQTYQGVIAFPTSPALAIYRPIQGLSSNMANSENIHSIDGAFLDASDPEADPEADTEEALHKNSITSDFRSGSVKFPSSSSLPSLSTPFSSDVPIGDEEFPSFEEWRRQNLDKHDDTAARQSKGKGKSKITETGEDEPESSVNPTRSAESQSFVIAATKDDPEIDAGIFDLDNSEPPSVADSAKVYKDRFNYASLDCAATIVKSNAKMKGATNILSENKDTYLINECSEPNKFVIIELCQDILVDNLAIANYEFFSSMFKDIRVSVSDRFPVSSSGWKVLGEFQAHAVRDLQFFYIKNPLIWARYIKIEFLSHWGREFYCPVSLVRVHGTTMMDEYKNQEAIDIARDLELAVGLGEKDEPAKDAGIFDNEKEALGTSKESELLKHTETLPTFETPERPPEVNSSQPFYAKAVSNQSSSQSASSQLSHKSSNTGDVTSVTTTSSEATCSPKPLFCVPDTLPLSMTIESLILDDSCLLEDYDLLANVSEESHTQDGPEAIDTAVVAGADTEAPINGTQRQASIQTTVPSQKTQDSIYQTITKRLSLLETNATITMKYIEIQSKHLRDILSKIEKKQSIKIEQFFDEFNNSLISQLYAFQQQYSTLLLTTIADFQEQRMRSDRDITALSSRMSLLADDLIYQRRLNVAQAVILLTVLVLVITTRGTYMESQWYMPGMSSASRIWRLGSPSESGFSSPKRSKLSRKGVMFGDDNKNEHKDEDEEKDEYKSDPYTDANSVNSLYVRATSTPPKHVDEEVHFDKDHPFYLSPDVSDDG